jgi:hypothetical protein
MSYEKEVKDIKQICIDIEWCADRIPEIFDGRDYVDIPDGWIDKLLGIDKLMESLIGELK